MQLYIKTNSTSLNNLQTTRGTHDMEASLFSEHHYHSWCHLLTVRLYYMINKLIFQCCRFNTSTASQCNLPPNLASTWWDSTLLGLHNTPLLAQSHSKASDSVRLCWYILYWHITPACSHHSVKLDLVILKTLQITNTLKISPQIFNYFQTLENF
jgi:hypothetical protein